MTIDRIIGKTLVKVIIGTGKYINGATIIQSIGRTRGKSGVINFVVGNAGGRNTGRMREQIDNADINQSIGQSLCNAIVGPSNKIENATVDRSVGQTQGESGVMNFVVDDVGERNIGQIGERCQISHGCIFCFLTLYFSSECSFFLLTKVGK